MNGEMIYANWRFQFQFRRNAEEIGISAIECDRSVTRKTSYGSKFWARNPRLTLVMSSLDTCWNHPKTTCWVMDLHRQDVFCGQVRFSHQTVPVKCHVGWKYSIFHLGVRTTLYERYLSQIPDYSHSYWQTIIRHMGLSEKNVPPNLMVALLIAP